MKHYNTNKLVSFFDIDSNGHLSSPSVLRCLCCSNFSLLCSVLQIIVCPFVLILLSLYCLSPSDLWLFITPLVCLNLIILMTIMMFKISLKTLTTILIYLSQTLTTILIYLSQTLTTILIYLSQTLNRYLIVYIHIIKNTHCFKK